jgi:hypothetical protein
MPVDVHVAPSDREFLLGLQCRALRYFLDNQTAGALILDRQANFEALRRTGWCSTAATGMGLIALALAQAEPYRLLTHAEAVGRVRRCVEAALQRLYQDHGIMGHFLDSETYENRGRDVFSTIDSSWLIAGALWAGAFLGDAELVALTTQLYDRVDWLYWTCPAENSSGLIRHGKGPDGNLLPGSWDRLDGETVFMYVLGAGAAPARALPAKSWTTLRPFYGTVAGLRFNNADLGLFAFQYGLDLLDLTHWRPPGEVDLAAEARVATRANYLVCQANADRFITYRRFWGLSDGDGPGDSPGTNTYRDYGPGRHMDGTAHLSATLASIAHAPGEVLENLRRADRDPGPKVHGRYGFSPINLDRNWIGSDMVGIDAGAAVLAVDNYLMENRVRRVFHGLPCVMRALERLGFVKR